MFDEADGPRKKPTFELGQKLDDLSVEELDETIETLRLEIERLAIARQSKSNHLDAAAALFAKKT